MAELPDVAAVTRDGDVVGGYFAAGGSASVPSLIEVQAALDQTRASLREAAASSERLQFELSALANERAETQGRADVALAKLHESDASMAAVAEELGQLGALARSAKAEAARATAAIAAAEESRDADIAGLADLESRLRAAQESSTEEPETGRREVLADQARLARQVEMDSRLALRTAEERARALRGRAEALVQAAEREREARARAVRLRERRRREAMAAAAVATGVTLVQTRLQASLAEASRNRSEVETTKTAHEGELVQTRAQVRALDAELAALTDGVHRDELLRAEQRMRLEQLVERVREELGLDLDTLVADYGPDQPVPSTSDDEADREPVPYVRAEQERRLRNAERALAQLGRINPLALEEFAALEERHRFLSEQLEDLKTDPAGPARHRLRGRRAGRAGLQRGLRRCGPRVRKHLRPAVPGR